MKYLILAAFLALPVLAQAQLNAKQELTTKFYSASVRDSHLSAAAEFLGKQAKSQGCLKGDFDAEVLKEAINRLFTKDTPGVVRFTWETFCSNSDLKDIRFYMDGIGYDEDYTEIGVKFITASKGEVFKKICAYGLSGEFRVCPFDYVPKPKWSVDQ